jgi:hypothetical protein
MQLLTLIRLKPSLYSHDMFMYMNMMYLYRSSMVLGTLRLPAVGYSKGYSKALEYEYRVKTAALGTLK